MRVPVKAKLPFADGRGGESHHGEPFQVRFVRVM